jgi:5-methylcytosine-specific restriction endonuclease McrA
MKCSSSHDEERMKLCASQWRKRHRDCETARVNRWRASHREAARAVYTRWARENPEKCAARDARYRARKVEATTIENDPPILVVYRRARLDQGVVCYLCGEKIPLGSRHVDHIIPLSRGGSHAAENLAIACARCNTSKGAKTPTEWAGSPLSVDAPLLVGAWGDSRA